MTLVRFQTPLRDLSVPSENLGKFYFQYLLKTSRKFELNQTREKVSVYLYNLAIACVKVKAISTTLLRLMMDSMC
jgi:hypothetical protein